MILKLRKKNKKSGFFIWLMLLLAVTCLSAFFISKYFFQFLLIRGDSMLPAYHSGQLVILEKQAGEIHRGDVIAFSCDGVKGILVKRVAGLPGDTVVIRNGILYINGQPDETIRPPMDYMGLAEEERQLGMEEYFVLGDNTKESRDSRYEEIGCVHEADIIGKILP